MEIFTYGSVGGAAGDRSFYPERDPKPRGVVSVELPRITSCCGFNVLAPQKGVVWAREARR